MHKTSRGKSYASDIRFSYSAMTTSAHPIPESHFNRLDSDDALALFTRFIECENELPDRPDLLLFAAENSPSTGAILEFGVYKGTSIRKLADRFPERNIYGFDSFSGLPEPWIRTTEGKSYEAGHFRLQKTPEVPDNVTLVEGFFEDTLPKWLRGFSEQVALLHIDSDLYSAAKLILESIGHYMAPGVVVVFDELCDWQDSGVYSAWPDGEWKALVEWAGTKNLNFEVIARGTQYSAAIRLTG